MNKRATEKENLKEFISYCFTPGTELFDSVKSYIKELVSKGIDKL